MKQEIVNCLTWYANKVAETVQYESWSDEYARKKVKESTDKLLGELKNHIDWSNLTEETLKELRFCRWATDESIDEDIADMKNPDAKVYFGEGETLEDKIASLERTKGLWLVPLYILPIVPIGMELISIGGRVVCFDGNNVDKDIRGGCIGYGIKLK